MARLFRGHPDARRRARCEIVERCRFSLDELRYEYPDEPMPPGQTPARSTWQDLAWARARAGAIPTASPDKVRATHRARAAS